MVTGNALGGGNSCFPGVGGSLGFQSVSGVISGVALRYNHRSRGALSLLPRAGADRRDGPCHLAGEHAFTRMLIVEKVAVEMRNEG
jgi:hypothetical protein